MSRWSWLALGFGAYLAFTLAMFPASTALRWFGPPGMTAAGVDGTLWSGSAASCSVGGVSAEAVRWQVNAWGLFLGRLDADVEARIPDGFLAANVAASPSSVRFSDLRAATSLPALSAFLPAVRGMRGQTSVALDSLVLDSGWPTSVVGEVRLSGLEAAPFIPDGSGRLLALGDYTVTFTPAPERELAAQFVDNGGPLQVSGSVTIDAARAYTLDALIKPLPGASDTLVEGLKFMTTEPDAEGRRRLTMTGSL
jgi:hypothetical protein